MATAGMVPEANRAVVLRYVDKVWNGHDLDAIDGLVSPDYANHAATTEEYRHGGGRQIWEWILSVFPDHRFDVEHIAADGDTVAVLGTMVGTHEGELMGIAPMSEGRVAEHWAVRDDLGMLQQLGVVSF